jgi:hypothetical protein
LLPSPHMLFAGKLPVGGGLPVSEFKFSIVYARDADLTWAQANGKLNRI